MALATRLLVNKEKMKPKASASPGSIRLGKLMNQYTRTFDLPEMHPETFASLLPKEFDKFKSSSSE